MSWLSSSFAPIAHEAAQRRSWRVFALQGRPLAAALLFLVALGSPGWALNVVPGWTEIYIKPGKDARATLTVTNETKEPMPVEISVKPGMGVDNKAVALQEWLVVESTPELTLKPGESREVPLLIRSPKGAPPELAGMVSFKYQTVPPSTVTPMLSVSVYSFAAGKAKPVGQVKTIEASTLPRTLAVAIEANNTGNAHYRPEGTVTVEQPAGHVIGQAPMPRTIPVFAGSSRYFQVQVPLQDDLHDRFVVRVELHDRDVKATGHQEFILGPDGKVHKVEAK